MNLTFSKAYSALSKLVEQIEDDKIQLDVLADKVKQAKELIDFCETKLRIIDEEVRTALNDNKFTIHNGDNS
ncbi:MAG: exodeoxyribonuclease VII small subunit [Chitinophagales bacterium]|nr:exodeoxyribonuclease VII small subunit [Chitinophagales bacterium]MDW8419895.1 exodeoxyribonuclease VII small subunit [Chitinophagales bacterium]